MSALPDAAGTGSSPIEGAHRRVAGRLRAVATVLAALAGLGLSPAAADLRIAIVPPTAGAPFFEQIRDGCVERAKALGSIECLFVEPGVDGRPADQAAVLTGLIEAKIDGIALSPGPQPAVAAAIAAATKAGIAVVTFDADLPNSGRRAFIGTNARDFGRSLGASLKRWKPKGGRFAILSADPKAPNLAERVAGVRDALDAGWTEIPSSPLITTGDFRDAVRVLDATLGAEPTLDAIVSVGAWPMLAVDDWRELVAKYKQRFDQAQVVVVVADALPVQMDLVREGLGHVLVGQRPKDMGSRAVDLLLALSHGKRVPEIVYVGFDTYTRLDLVKPKDEAPKPAETGAPTVLAPTSPAPTSPAAPPGATPAPSATAPTAPQANRPAVGAAPARTEPATRPPQSGRTAPAQQPARPQAITP